MSSDSTKPRPSTCDNCGHIRIEHRGGWQCQHNDLIGRVDVECECLVFQGLLLVRVGLR